MFMYRLKAAARFIRYHLRFDISYRPYMRPDNVGYRGCYSTSKRALAFERLDGSLQFNW